MIQLNPRWHLRDHVTFDPVISRRPYNDHHIIFDTVTTLMPCRDYRVTFDPVPMRCSAEILN